MATIKEILDSKLSNNPVAELIEQPKHLAKGGNLTVIRNNGDDAPLEDDDLPEAPKENPYTRPIDEIKEELGETDQEDKREFRITPDKKVDFSKQSNKIITIADKLQMFVCGLIADVEDIEQFKFTEFEKEEFMLFLPDIAEEHGLTVSNEWGLGLSFLMALLRRAKQAYRMRKDAKDLKQAA